MKNKDTLTTQNRKIARYHKDICELIRRVYSGSNYSLEILLDKHIFTHGYIKGKRILVRYLMSQAEKSQTPKEVFIYEDYVTLIVESKMSNLRRIRELVSITPPTEPYPKPFVIYLPEPVKFIQLLIAYSTVFELNVKTVACEL